MVRRELDAVVVGAGFAGMYMLHRLRGMGLAVRVLEAGGGVGGTWYWNRYPGARCDVESMEYSYQFSDELQQEWEWSERYATQAEILRYANHVADRFELRRDIQFDTRVTSASFDEAAGRWRVLTADGAEMAATFCIMATGCLSSPNRPHIEGVERFEGRAYHTGDWPHEGVDFTGLRVGVIGTGSSAIQAIPLIARQARQLFVFQRTPNYAVPAQNAPLDPEAQRAVKANYAALRARARQGRTGLLYPINPLPASAVSSVEQEREYQARWERGGLGFIGSFVDLLVDRQANDTAAEFIRGKIRAAVRDPAVADALSPRSVVGCKRLCVDIGYYETFNRANVTLIDLRKAPIEGVTERGVRVGGEEHQVDALVFATGFDAMTGALLRIDIRGAGGRTLREKWAAGPRTYLGVAIAGFPNLFTITGPGSPSVLSNMLPSIEQHVEWIADAIGHLRARGLGRIEATRAAEEKWVAHVNAVANATLFPSCNSWYIGANVPGKPRVFMPYIGVPPYVQKSAEVAANGYEGFALGA
ncbi:MAG TPA: NAD(P)/FAD-dependent oxidoreductase [Geminicoccaceae bacterium]|nr:NAD(P)/FAD-dependent oxidoreductase [Geminicoccaceae bacterium]